MFRFSHHAVRLFIRTGTRPVCLCLRKASTAPRPTVVPVQSRASVPAAAPPVQISLRDYQEECIQSVLAYIQKGHKRLGVSLATGSGKTVIFTHLIDRVPAVGDATQALILAHRRELVQQAAKHCTLAYPDKSVDIELGSHHASGAADITVASIQSLMSGDRIDRFDPARFKLILVDEAHHIASPQYLAMLEYFGLRHRADWTQVSAPALVGVSATFSRHDGKSLGAAIDHIVYHRDYLDMIEENWLSDVIFTTVQINADLNKVRSGANGDFLSAALSQAINTDETNEIAVKAWKARAKDRQSTLVFCVDLDHVANLTAKFRQHDIAADFVTGDTPAKKRAAKIEAFRNGEYRVLLNCGVFTEGTDIPNIDCVLLARPTKSRNLLVQMIGRGMRLHAGKENCHIIDLVAALSTSVISTPTLFGLDPAELVENADHKEMKELKERKEKEKEREQQSAERLSTARAMRSGVKTLSFTDYDSVHDLLADSSNDKYVRNVSENAWVSVGDGKFVLSNRNGEYLVIEPSAGDAASRDNTETAFHVKYYQKIPGYAKSKSPYGRPRVVAQGESFRHTIRAADTFAAEVFERMWISWKMSWRRAEASDAQLKFLNGFRQPDDALKASDVTKGQAADMITRIKHGVKGKFAKASSRKKAQDRKKDTETTLKEKLQGEVKVGPILLES